MQPRGTPLCEILNAVDFTAVPDSGLVWQKRFKATPKQLWNMMKHMNVAMRKYSEGKTGLQHEK